MSAQTSPAPKIWINTASGPMIRPMGRYGFLRSRPDGRRIKRAGGYGKTFTAGLGSVTILGAGRRIITGAGSTGRSAGPGILARFTRGITGRRLMWAFSVGAGAPV